MKKRLITINITQILLLTTFLASSYTQEIVEVNLFKKEDLNTEFIKNISLIPLESGTLAQIGEINEIAIDKSDIFILDKKNQFLKRFSFDGKYLNNIGSRGKGPGEVGYFFSFCVDQHNKQVLISDLISKNIKFFDYDGNYIKSIDSKYSIKRIFSLGESGILCHHGRMGFLSEKEGEFHELICYDQNGNALFKLFPFEKARYHDLLPGIGKHLDGHSVIYHKGLDNKLYKITEDGSLSEEYVFDFKRYNIDTTLFSLEGVDGLTNMSRYQDEILGYSDVNMTRDFLTLKAHSNKNKFYLITNRITNSCISVVIDESGYIGKTGQLFIPAARAIYQDRFVGIINPIDLIMECESTGEKPEKVLNQFDVKGFLEINENSNPILMLYNIEAGLFR